MSNLPFEDIDDEQAWESEKFTFADELAYKSGIDKAPEKEPDYDKLHAAHLERIQNERSHAYRLAAVEEEMSKMSLDRLQDMHVSSRSGGQADLSIMSDIRTAQRRAEAAYHTAASNTHGEHVKRVADDDDEEGNSSDDSLFDDDDNAGDGGVARLVEDIRRKRIMELKARMAAANASGAGVTRAGAGRGGAVVGLMAEIQPEDFAEGVTAASKNGFVILFVYHENHGPSDVLGAMLGNISTRFPSVKFVRIRHCSALSSVPARDCPLVMVYRNGRPARQFSTLEAFHGPKTTAADVEWALAKIGAVPSDMQEDPREAALFE